ncbi:hypothetical protein BaRGS_00005981, partial [Batillaria attramentaria]
MIWDNISREVNDALGEGIGRLYEDKMFFDLKVIISGATFECHRAVLAAVSEFFMSSLACTWQEGTSRVVHIDHEDVTVESFNLLLEVMYYDAVITEETAKVLLKTATYLQIPFLETACIRFLGLEPSSERCLGIMQLARRYDLDRLYERVLSHAVKNFAAVVKSKEFLDVPKAILLVLLMEYTQLRKSDAVTVLQAVIRWVEADVPSRLSHFGELLQFVNFTGFWCLELTQTLCPPIKNSSICSQYLIDYWTTEVSECMLKPVTHTSITDDGLRDDFIHGHGAVCHSHRDETPVWSTMNLKPVPDDCGLCFASCVCDNRLYVSGGSVNPQFFAVYSPKKNEWDTLPSLPQGREKHRMVAVNWNIYVLGGWDAEGQVQDTLVYSIKSKKWTKWGQLAVTGSHIAAAALGHRIYIFCGPQVEGTTDEDSKEADGETGKEPSDPAGAEDASAIKTQDPNSLGQSECIGDQAAANNNAMGSENNNAVDGDVHTAMPASQVNFEAVDISGGNVISSLGQSASGHAERDGAIKTPEEAATQADDAEQDKAESEDTDREYRCKVFCLDTLSRDVYLSGTLSVNYEIQGLHALSDGGTIYLDVSGFVYKMVENFALADKLEETLRKEKDHHDGEDMENSSALDAATETGDIDNTAEVNADGQSNSTADAQLQENVTSLDLLKMTPLGMMQTQPVSTLSTVEFWEVGWMSDTLKHYGMYRRKDELVACGGTDVHETDSYHDLTALTINSGRLRHKQQTLLTPRSHFGLQILHVPEKFLCEHEGPAGAVVRFCFSIDQLDFNRRRRGEPERFCPELKSNQQTVCKTNWFVSVKQHNDANHVEHVGVFLNMVQDTQRNQTVKVKFECRLIPDEGLWDDWQHCMVAVFADRGDFYSKHGWETLYPLE